MSRLNLDAEWMNSGPLTLPGRTRFETFGDVDFTNLPIIRSDCPCCMKNVEMIKIQIMLTKTVQTTGRSEWEMFRIFSRPETMSCADCERIKTKLETMRHWQVEGKDEQGFIRFMTPMDKGIRLLQDTAVFKVLLPNFRP